MAENTTSFEKPVKITYKKTGETYILDFSRETAMQAQSAGLDLSQIMAKMTTTILDLFYFALLKEQKFVSRTGAKKLFEKLFPDGMPDFVLERLGKLYAQASTAGVIYCADDEDANTKNVDTEIE